jgi:hypothetical protein
MAMNKMGDMKNVKAPIKKAAMIKPMAAKARATPKSAPKNGLKGNR